MSVQMVRKKQKEVVMFIFDKNSNEFIPFDLRAFAERADRDVVLLDPENGKVLEYYPGYLSAGGLKDFIPDVESVETIHVAIFTERFGRKVVDRTLQIKRLHEVFDLFDRSYGLLAAFIADSDSLLVRLQPKHLGAIINTFFID